MFLSIKKNRYCLIILFAAFLHDNSLVVKCSLIGVIPTRNHLYPYYSSSVLKAFLGCTNQYFLEDCLTQLVHVELLMQIQGGNLMCISYVLGN